MGNREGKGRNLLRDLWQQRTAGMPWQRQRKERQGRKGQKQERCRKQPAETKISGESKAGREC